MQKLKFSGSFSGKKEKVSMSVGVFQFEEDGTTIVYSPAFDLSGYGKSPKQAKDSFEETLEAFLDYAIKKKTFVVELNRLGWKLKQSDILKRKFTAPLFPTNDSK
jgi:hypothetical protein